MTIAGKTVCVTGAAGFLGSWLCRELVGRNARVIGLDNFSIGPRERLSDVANDIELVTADVRDADGIAEHVSRSDVVFHLAAIDSRQACQRDFDLAFDVNVGGTKNVLSHCSGVERVVVMSSTMVYGEPTYQPVDEAHATNGYEPYAVTKIASEGLCRAYGFNEDVAFTIVRNSNTFGPGQGPDYLVPSLILEALNRGRIDVWTPGVVRDFQYVEDCVDGLIQIAETEATLGETVNLGTGTGTTTGQLAEKICEMVGSTWEDLGKAPPVSAELIADVTKLRRLTGWEPEIGLEDGLARTIEHWTSKAPVGSGEASRAC